MIDTVYHSMSDDARLANARTALAANLEVRAWVCNLANSCRP
jgi:hypothetical protein